MEDESTVELNGALYKKWLIDYIKKAVEEKYETTKYVGWIVEQAISRYNNDVNYYKFVLNLEKNFVIMHMSNATSGAVIGEGYHGGMSCEEWAKEIPIWENMLKTINDFQLKNT